MVDSLTKNKPITVTIASAIIVVIFVIGTTWEAGRRFQKLEGDVTHVTIDLDAVKREVAICRVKETEKEITFARITANITAKLDNLEKTVNEIRKDVKQL